MSNLAKIHIAKKQLGLDDDTYRDVLERVTNKRSSKGMSSKQHLAVLDEFKRLGWKPYSNRQKWRKRSDKDYVRKIFAIWTDLKNRNIWRDKRRASLVNFVRDMTGMDDPDFLTPTDASKIIEALKAIEKRHKAGAE